MTCKTKKKTLFIKVHKRTAVMVELHVIPSTSDNNVGSDAFKKGRYLWFTEHHLNELVSALCDVALAKILTGGVKTRSKLTQQQNSNCSLSVSGLDLHAIYSFKRRHANELFLVCSQTGKHKNLTFFPEKLVVVVSQPEKENIGADTHPTKIESAPLSSMTPARPGISDYFTKQDVADVTDSTKKKQLTLQNIVRRAKKKQPGTTQPLLPLYSTSLTASENPQRSIEGFGNDAHLYCFSKQNLKDCEHDPVEQEHTNLPDFEDKCTLESSTSKNILTSKDFHPGDYIPPVEIRSEEQQKTCNKQLSQNNVKETESKGHNTKRKKNMKLRKKRKIGYDDITSGSETVDVDLSDFELKPRTAAKRMKHNSTAESVEPINGQKDGKLSYEKESTEDVGCKKGHKKQKVNVRSQEIKRRVFGDCAKLRSRIRKNQVQEESATSVSEHCSSGDEQRNAKSCLLERVDEENEEDDNVAAKRRVRESIARVEAKRRSWKGSIIEVSDDCCETLSRDQITIQDTVPDFSNVKKIEDLSLEHIDFIVWNKKEELRRIFEGKKYSERHEDYKKGGKLKDNLAFQVRFGVFSDEQQEAMMDVLISMFCYKHSKYLDYVTKVLLPETMIMVYQEIFKVSSEGVEELLIEVSSAKV